MRTSLLATLLCSTLLAACTPTQGNSHKDSAEYKAAYELKQSGNIPAAADAWRRMVQADANDIESAIELSAAERKLGHAEDAAQLMAQYNEKFPDNAAIISQMGYALIDAGKTEEAVNAFEIAHNLQPENPIILSGKAVAFDKAGNHLAAQDIYKEALMLSPDSVTLKNNLGMSLILNNEPKAAIEMLEPLYAQNASNQTIRQNLALAYGMNGDSKKALELNMKDLSAEEAQENLIFYQKYMKQHKKNAEKTDKEPNIGFTETTEDIKTKPIKKATDVEAKPTLKVIPLKLEEPKDAPKTPEIKKPTAKKAEPEQVQITFEKPKLQATASSPPEVPATPTGTPLPTRTFEAEPQYPGQMR